ncbi:PREDICTED: mechanosensitive ion channel protein 2, chloroplastic [Populus euphratica]|uniref:Mechanosensitive ion channel protein 2, chloroplastic n=1 Tax=Populus euphratica TaxID=75702 RepID=A0AAJ6XKF8_POPEU|nr:PREDICTED: mechanosensitive ion channel protein 2, chloroplastic [Populus euphratica]
MAISGSLQFPHDLGFCKNQPSNNNHNQPFKSVLLGKGKVPVSSNTSLKFRLHDCRLLLQRPIYTVSLNRSNDKKAFRCRSFLVPRQALELPAVKAASVTLTRSFNALQTSPLVFKLAPAVGIIVFAVWGLGPLMRQSRNLLFHKSDNSWKKSGTYYVMASYIQPLMLWTGAILICRALDPVVLPTEASEVVKQRLLNFVRSLSTVLAFAYCLSSMIQQAQKFFMVSSQPSDARNMGFQFAGRAVYSAVWVAAVSLFMELLGFSTQKWLTAGGLGTVLLTLAGREIFTNFLSSAMIHATRPFVVNEWIQTKIEGYEVSGTVEHVGWWSPTIVRGEDREAVHIPNHKFTVNVVRNLSQKTHWRIKTHLAISHLDAHKINNIVADMRKVLAKNPQVEQQRLHRRIFLDNINPENQALLILVSCFVKTSHHEEYLCVKEAVLLDLLRVISHHRARLATPIRTIQKIYSDTSDTDMENVPFTDSIYNHGGVASKRPLLLIEPSYRINGEDKAKSQARSGRVTGEKDSKTTSRLTSDTKAGTNTKSDTRAKETPKSDSKGDANSGETPNSDAKVHTKSTTVSASHSRVDDKMTVKSPPTSALKTNSNATEASGLGSKAAGLVSDNLNKNKTTSDAKSKTTSPANVSQNSKVTAVNSQEAGTEKGLKESSQSNQGKRSVSQPSSSRSALEENIVLGVALEGSKRTLPIDEDIASHPTPPEEKEMAAASQNGTGSPTTVKDRRDGPPPTPTSTPTPTSGDQ